MKIYESRHVASDHPQMCIVSREHNDASGHVEVVEDNISSPEYATTKTFNLNIASRLDHLFSTQPIPEAKQYIIQQLRDQGKALAETIMRFVPGADGSAAVRKVREAVMTATAGIAKDGIA